VKASPAEPWDGILPVPGAGASANLAAEEGPQARKDYAGFPSSNELEQTLLEIVSEKTGYPVETIELDMDLEADLGVDSIKRVEIMDGAQAAFPGLPVIDTERLAEMRTLRQIVQGFESEDFGRRDSGEPATAGLSSPEGSTARASEGRKSTLGAEHLSEEAAAEKAILAKGGAAQTEAGEHPSLEMLEDELVSVVSEKTGYPQETIDLDMDMEADLGIDSIKRVEILDALQTRHEELPTIDSDQLAELRTLRQLAEALVKLVEGEQAPGGSPQ
jgi:acyl carrier protein